MIPPLPYSVCPPRYKHSCEEISGPYLPVEIKIVSEPVGRDHNAALQLGKSMYLGS